MKLPRGICLAGAILALAATSQTRAGDPAVNPTGTWELKTLNASNQPPAILKLKLANGAVTGTLSRNAGAKIEQLPLEDTRLQGSELAFTVHVYTLHYEHNVLQPTDTNQVTVATYHGLITGDTIQGQVEKKSWREGASRTLAWEARRVRP